MNVNNRFEERYIGALEVNASMEADAQLTLAFLKQFGGLTYPEELGNASGQLRVDGKIISGPTVDFRNQDPIRFEAIKRQCESIAIDNAPKRARIASSSNIEEDAHLVRTFLERIHEDKKDIEIERCFFAEIYVE